MVFKEGKFRWVKHLDFIVLDIVVLFISYIVANILRYGSLVHFLREASINVLGVIVLVNIIGIVVLEAYKNVLKRGYFEELKALCKQTAYMIVGATLYLFAVKQSEEFSRLILFYFVVVYLGIGYISRLILKKIVRKKIIEQPKQRVLLVTESELLEDVMKSLMVGDIRDYEIIGIALLDEKMRKNDVYMDVPIVAGREDIIEYATHEWVDRVLLHVVKMDKYIEDIMHSFVEMGLTLQVGVMPSNNIMGNYQSVDKVGNFIVVTNSIFHMSTMEIIGKRLLDIAGGLVGCLITILLTIILGPIIYIQSPGPIFFKQKRVGLNGKVFYIYKFRSMYMDAEQRKKELQKDNRVGDGMMFKLDWDPRIIGSKILSDGTHKKGIGNYIRDFSLDEFPQFFNVLKGDMSLVGTRPPTMDEWEKYEKHHRARLAMKPGITGLWQVSGRSNITDFEEVVRLDTQYITEWSMGLDLKILFKTVWVVFHRDGAM